MFKTASGDGIDIAQTCSFGRADRLKAAFTRFE
jgi:hypothetical protein